MNKRPDRLQERADERRKQLVATLTALKLAPQPDDQASARAKKLLAELNEQIKHGWQSENIEVRTKLKDWLDSNEAVAPTAA
jgi:hypothetical protein